METNAIFFDNSVSLDKVWQDASIFKLVKIKMQYYLVKIIAEFLRDRSFKSK